MSEFNLDSSTGSLLVVLVMAGIMTGFGTLVYGLLVWIFGDERGAERPHVGRARQEPPVRKAA